MIARRRVVWFAIGNPLRGDDGVAHAAVAELQEAPFVHKVHQLAPEHAAELEGAGEVLFVDADASAQEVTVEILNESADLTYDSHLLSPSDIVLLARILFDFHGDAYLCRIPAQDLSLGEKLSPEGTRHARRASHILKKRFLASKDLFDAPLTRTFDAACDGGLRRAG